MFSWPLLHPIWVLLPWGTALLTVWLISLFLKPTTTSGRFDTIDGLRGHLAFAVYLHHGVIWHGYLRSGKWSAPNSDFYNLLGQGSVALFFMITGFLFIDKLIADRDKPIDWLRLYVSRVLRLSPLYLTTISVMLVMCGALTQWERHVSWYELVRGIFRWSLFTIGGGIDVNGLANTFVLTAGVTWSLPFEWQFYLALPTIAWLMKRDTSRRLVIATLLGVLFIWAKHKQPIMFLGFLGGGASAWLVHHGKLTSFSKTPMASAVVVAIITTMVLTHSSAYTKSAMLLLSCAFALIASGTSVFGLLQARISRLLGDLSYGLYLLHGMTLFTVWHAIVGRSTGAAFSDAQHWLTLTATAPLVVLFAYASFHWIEQPSMLQTRRISDWLQQRLIRS